MANLAPLVPGDPEWLGAYRLVGRLGQGGQGTVYLARSPYGQPVAVKLLRAEWTRDPVARARFAREVAAVGRVAPFCTARILDAHLDGDQPFVVSEFIDGPSLQAVVAREGPLAGSALDRLAVSIATALSAIHQAGVIHRDLKPGNVLLGPDGARVIDFGLARSADAASTLTSQLFGTPGYMAPEVMRGEPAGPSADVFAWAATITFAANGNPPFHAPNMAAIIHQVTQGEPDLGTLSGDLWYIVAECLAKDPAARPTTADLLARLLRRSRDDGMAAQPPGFWQPAQTVPMPGRYEPAGEANAAEIAPPPRQGRRGRAVAGWTAAFAGLAALCVIGGLFVPRLIAGPPAVPAPGGSPSGPPHAGQGHVPSALGNAIPARFAGTWNGEARQAGGVVTRWAATLVLPQGGTTGTFTIPSIPCRATVTVAQVTRARILLNETVDSNPSGNCAASGVISLDRAGAARVRMLWTDAGDPGNVATGILIRS